ncbi:hypothetical protein BJ742DRAFT_773075 [Cladochytrium replicatum]|nr:hypothetical protein BJ742DRAFT_773075 [Cladochytrium replicatum]
MVTSADALHPPENTLDGVNGPIQTFWITAGLFLQEFIITLPQVMNLKKQVVWSCKEIERSTDYTQDFEPVGFMVSIRPYLAVPSGIPWVMFGIRSRARGYAFSSLCDDASVLCRGKAAAANAPTTSNAPVSAKGVRFRIKKGFNE